MKENPQFETKVIGLKITDRLKIWWVKWSIRIIVPLILFFVVSLTFKWAGEVAHQAKTAETKSKDTEKATLENKKDIQENTDNINALQDATPAPNLPKRVETLEKKAPSPKYRRKTSTPTPKPLWDRIFHP
jgi:hypothetical protein